MKKTLLFLAACGLLHNAVAQAPITSSINPSVGFSSFSKAADTTGVVPGPAGANQTWNFSLNVTGLAVPSSVIPAAGTAFASSFPTANLASNAGNGSYAYFLADNSQYTFLGIGTTNYVDVYTDPETYFSYPLNYNVPQTDNFAGNYSYDDGSGGTIHMTHTGTHTATYDGYGTLIVNGHTFNNVVRIKNVDDITYTSDIPSSSTSHSEAYLWLQPNSPEALLSISSNVSDFGSGIVITSKSVNVSTLATGVDEIGTRSHLGISVQSSLNQTADGMLVINAEKPSNGSAEVYNTIGELISSVDFSANAGVNVVALPTSGLSKGLYLVRVKEANGKVTGAQKLVVQ